MNIFTVHIIQDAQYAFVQQQQIARSVDLRNSVYPADPACDVDMLASLLPDLLQ